MVVLPPFRHCAGDERKLRILLNFKSGNDSSGGKWNSETFVSVQRRNAPDFSPGIPLSSPEEPEGQQLALPKAKRLLKKPPSMVL